MNTQRVRGLALLIRWAEEATKFADYSVHSRCFQTITSLRELSLAIVPSSKSLGERRTALSTRGWPRWQTIKAQADIPSFLGADDAVIDEFLDSQQFQDLNSYFRQSVGLSGPAARDLAIKLAFVGFTADGQPYTRLSPLALPLSTTSKVIEFLQSIPGVDLPRVARSSPFVLAPPAEALPRMHLNAEKLMSSLGLTDAELGKILNSNAYPLTQSLDKSTEPALQFLTSTVGLSGDRRRTAVLRFPRVLSLKVKRLERTLETLRVLGLDEQQMLEAVARFPAVFSLSAEKIHSVVAWLESHGIPPGAAITTIARFPNLLSYSVQTNLQPTVEYLTKELKLTARAIRHIITYAPDLLARKPSTLAARAASAKEAGIVGDDFDSMVNAYPGSLRVDFGSPRHAAKLQFLREELGKEVGPALATNPMFVTYSFERIASRVAFLKERQRPVHSLTAFLSCDDQSFASRFALSTLEEWMAFKTSWLESSQSAMSQKDEI